MGLKTYRQKRDFKRTPEPSGHRPPSRDQRRLYVIQKHAATRLHYDLRLEDDGVLKSWAVPKGPSLNPKDKRLAVQVEDHPVDYGSFEGTIPKGEYGGGSVLLWDRGHWKPKGDLEEGWRKGSVKFELEGEKLHGGWALVRLRQSNGDKPNWLLVKEKDEEADTRDIVKEQPESVASGRLVEDIGKDQSGGPGQSKKRSKKANGKADRVRHSNRPGRSGGKARSLSKRAAGADPVDPSTIPGAKKAPLPKFAGFELTTLVDDPPSGDDWLHEIKLDGFRIQCRIASGNVTLITRTGKDWTHRFPDVAEAAKRLPVETAVLDGELVALQPDGRSSFQGLQQALYEGREQALVYFAFDLPYLDGYDLSPAALEDRKHTLQQVFAAHDGTTLRYSDHVVGGGEEFYKRACQMGLEGIIAKLRTSSYRPARRRDWVKVKCLQRQEFVIGGYTEPEGARSGLGALLLGVYDDKETLRYAGRVGTGFNDRMLQELEKRLGKLEQEKSPFHEKVPGSLRGIHWVRPALVAEIQFTEWTADGRLRHPSFQGLREDKKPQEVKREVPKPVAALPQEKKTRKPGGPKAKTISGHTKPKPARDAGHENGELAGIRLTHPAKVLYPEQGVTKQDLAEYYASIADHILPHIAGRPLMLVRCPEGHAKACFYQKHVTDQVPKQIKSVAIDEDGKKARYLMVNDLAGLIAVVQMGTLELHVWGSTARKLEYPDRLVFDLDPAPDVPWRRVVEAARLVRARLDALGLQSWVKTTGGKGLNVVVPVAPKQGWDRVKAFTRAVAEAIVEEAPDRYTSTMAKAKRKGKIFIDYLRNGRGATAVATYSTRARSGATVSVPVSWDELETVDPKQFTVATVPRRLASQKADPWKGFERARQSITQAMLRKLGLEK